VAQRTITYQAELQKSIDEMQMLLQRYNLLGEMFGRQGRQVDASITDRSQDERAHNGPGPAQTGSHELTAARPYVAENRLSPGAIAWRLLWSERAC